MSLKSQIKTALKGNRALTVGEILEAIEDSNPYVFLKYPSVRARVYEMANRGELFRRNTRADRTTGAKAGTYALRPAPVKLPSFSTPKKSASSTSSSSNTTSSTPAPARRAFTSLC